MPVEIDMMELRAIGANARLGPLWIVTIGKEQERFPGSFEAVLKLSGRRAEDVRSWTERGTALQDGRQAPMRIEWDATVLRVLGIRAWNSDLVSVAE
jgi:hypothetical protein